MRGMPGKSLDERGAAGGAAAAYAAQVPVEPVGAENSVMGAELALSGGWSAG